MKWKDSNDGVETAVDEEGTFEEDYSPLRNRKLNSGSRLVSILTRSGTWLVIIPVLLLAIFFFVIRPGGSDKALLTAINQRLQQIENRMAALEGISELVTDLDKDRQATGPLMARMDRFELSIAKRINDMEQQLKELQTRFVNSEAKRGQAAVVKSQPPVVKSQPPKKTAKTHVVKKGETLYSISRQYELSVNQLMSFNKLSKGAVINPGQTLKLAP
jgi:LysM repeat protein